MDQSPLNMLSYAAGVVSPLRIELTRQHSETETAEPEIVEIAKPFAVIGRNHHCDVVIDHHAVSSKHIYLQAIGNRLAGIDLFSTSGTQWTGADYSGWLGPDHSVRIPGATLKISDAHWMVDPTLKAPLEFRPRDEQRDEYGQLPKVELELLNTSAKGKKWPINRTITLVGKDERCRITILDEKISRVHCSLLLLPSGLWIIDLTGKMAFTVQGQQCACALLAEAIEFQLGPYVFAAHYPEVSAQMYQAQSRPLPGESDFLTQHNRIIKTESYDKTVVILPVGDSQSYLYQDVHNEANRVIDLIKRRQIQHVVVDFSQSESVGHLIAESLVAICRAVRGKAALCACSVETYEMLQRTKLFQIWPHYQTRQDAMQAVTYSA